MQPAIKAEIFLVPVEDHSEAIEDLEKSGIAYCTFPHNTGEFMAIAVASGNGRKKKVTEPPAVPQFPGQEGE